MEEVKTDMVTLDENVVLMNDVKLAIIGFGQAGAKLAMAIANKTKTDVERCIVINTSEADLRSIPWFLKDNRILIDRNGKGAGKDRDKVLGMIQQSNPEILEKVDTILHKDFDMLITCYSADGGTGSGSGPIMTALFSTDQLSKKHGDIPVIGICMLPDHNVGILGLQNALSNINESNKFLKNNRLIEMFVDNDIYAGIADPATRYQQINDDVAELLHRYINVSYVSSSSNLDFADRAVMLATPGIHSLCKFDENGVPKSPFLLPEGSLVSKMAVEMREGTAGIRDKLNNNVGCIINESSFMGFYKDGTPGAYPVCHYAGFTSLDKLATRYQSWISQIQQKAEQQKKVDRENGRGFNNLEANAKFIKSESSVNTDGDFNDLFSMMNS